MENLFNYYLNNNLHLNTKKIIINKNIKNINVNYKIKYTKSLYAKLFEI